jgi:DtxR family Mn-dependent transcriptional regulator
MNLSKSKAHYVKAIYALSAACDVVRICDIAEALCVSRASVSLAMKRLVKQGLVRKDTEHHIFLTKDGTREAVLMLDTFEMIRRFLAGVLEVNEEVAEHDACAIEHVISADTLCAMCQFYSCWAEENGIQMSDTACNRNELQESYVIPGTNK